MFPRLLRATLALPFAFFGTSAAFAVELDPKGVAFFESKIRPVLIDQCYECHSAKSSKLKGGLLLDTRDGLLKGGDTGPSIVAGKPDDSLLIKALRHDKMEMPPKKKLSDSIIADFVQWVRIGAPDPRDGGAGYKRLSLEESRSFWSFVPVGKPTPPNVKNTGWTRNDADRLILAKLEERGLKPVGDAEPALLARRLYFDIIGLPPPPEEVERFVAAFNAKPQAAMEELVDRLLLSPRYGERWGRYWLDLARYAESNGNADNTPFPEAWRYRDYVIAAHNADTPYDQFVREQIAGDLIPADEPAKRDAQLTATAFLALTSKPRAQNNPDYKFDLIADQIDVTTRTVMSLSVMCARCHDHKFDPVSTKEYYALAGIFDSTSMLFGNVAPKGGGKNNPGGGFHTLSNGANAMGVKERGSPVDCKIAIRGESQKLGDTVPRGFLAAATVGEAPKIDRAKSGRLELAQWLTTPENPLTARVAVNRIWMHLFGQGIVKSADNFGFLGDKPSHPELLDHLASKFMAEGWSTKKMIRYLVLSRTYQLASAYDDVSFKIDPDNVLRWRMTQRRLDAEAFRDATLSVSGKLELTPPKGSIAAPIPGKGGGRRPVYNVRETAYRSIYLGIPRGAPLPESLSLFDVANPNVIIAQREETTVPAQALYLMNSPFILDQARLTAERLLNVKNLNDAERVDLAYKLFCARPATAAEKDRVLKYIAETTKDIGKSADAWASFCQTMIASAEFRYLR